MRLLLDTTLLIDHLRGLPVARQRLSRLFDDGDEPIINEVVAAELWSGAHASDDPDVKALVEAIEFIQPGPEAAHRAGRWRADARSRGRTLSVADALIAAAADANDATVITRNTRDFSLTPIRVETY